MAKEPGYSGDIVEDPKEVERKFLINPVDLPTDLDIEAQMFLTQAYVAIADDGSETRIRHTQTADNGYDECELTVKSKGNLVRGEQTILISRSMYDRLLGKRSGNIIQKRRVTIPYGEHIIELDFYTGDLDGLVVAEVEFRGADEADAVTHATAFNPPAWFGAEVTKDKDYKNQALAINGLPEYLLRAE